MRRGRWAGGVAAVVAGVGIAAGAGLAVGITVAGGVKPVREHTTDDHFLGECPGTRVTFTAPPTADPPS